MPKDYNTKPAVDQKAVVSNVLKTQRSMLGIDKEKDKTYPRYESK